MSRKSFVCVLVTAIVVTLALCLSLVVSASPTVPGIEQTMAEASFGTQAEYPLFTDNFENGMRPEWQIVAGFWGVVSEDGNHVMQGSDVGGPIYPNQGLVLQETTAANIVIEADIRNIDPQGQYVDAGLIWGNTASVGTYQAIPGYVLEVSEGKLLLAVIDDIDGSSTILNSATVSLDPNTYYHYEFEIHADGLLVGRVEDSTGLLAEITARNSKYVGDAKHPGLWADLDYWGAGYWDNFYVASYTSCPPYCRWDINQDCRVDYKDLAILGAHYGEVY